MEAKWETCPVHAQVHPVHSSYWNQVEGSFQVDLCLHYIDVVIDDPACSDLLPKFSVYYVWICVCCGLWIGCMKAKVYSVTKWCEFAGRRVV